HEIPTLSAETNILNKKNIQKDDFIYFICGDSGPGKLCGEILAELYGGGNLCKIVPIKGLVANSTDFANTGMKNLMHSLVEIIEMHNKHAVIHATGGFKAQIALATLAGILFQINVYYLYEDFEDVIQLPAVPLDFNYDVLMASHQEFFTLIDAREYLKSDELYNNLPETLKGCFYKDKILKKYNLTPLGRAMFNNFRRQMGVKMSSISISITGESGLWGEDNNNTLGEILNPMIGMILERISRYTELITSFHFSSKSISTTHRSSNRNENYIELLDKGPNYLKYRVEHMTSKKGIMDIITLNTTTGMAQYLLNLLGRKIYP
ncbi:MAG: putative CRISPR-associated protein, partial [Desulfamplus sp.]|nr:putative CRISPR-associated protein [Desulfamplus sp.]